MESSRFGRRRDRRRSYTKTEKTPTAQDAIRMLRYLRLMVLDSLLSSRLRVKMAFSFYRA